MENLTQTFLDLARLRKDNWECHPGFIAKEKQSFNPQVLSTRDQCCFFFIYIVYKCAEKK
jgi:hypothetical protein